MVHRPAPKPDDEQERLLALGYFDILDSAPEQGFDDIVLLASTLCEVPIALVSLVDRDRQWFKACTGLDVRETHRDLAFCAHAILAPDEVLVVPDTHLDPRFQHSGLVLGPPYIRFYAGAPIRTQSGQPLGTVCVIDTRPRQLTEPQRLALLALARQTAALLELRLLDMRREQHSAELIAQLDQALEHNQTTERSLRQARRVSSLGMLTAGIAHDFNNLLQAISASLQMIQLRSRRPLDVERFCETGLQAVDQGGRLVEHLMSSVRSDGPEVICIDVSERIEAARDLLARTATPHIDLSLDLQARGLGVLCDEAQLQAVLMNLLINARDALAGPGRVRIATRQVYIEDDVQLAQGDYLLLSVSDNGPGMPATVAAEAFEPFFTTKQAGRGTGLGLSRAREFALNAGGGVKLHTEPGVGTTLNLYLRVLGRIDAQVPESQPVFVS